MVSTLAPTLFMIIFSGFNFTFFFFLQNVYNKKSKGGSQSAYHLPMILPFLAQRLFLIQISWNLKSVLSLGSYTWKNGQIRSAGRTIRQNRRFSGDRFFHVLDHLESIWKKKISAKIFAQKNLEKFRDLSRWHDSFIFSR